MKKHRLLKLFSNNFSKLNFYLLIITVFLVVFFLYRGTDLAFHLERMDAILVQIRANGVFSLPIYVYASTLSGYGYASPLFYCDLFFYPFAIFGALFNLSVITVYKYSKLYFDYYYDDNIFASADYVPENFLRFRADDDSQQDRWAFKA